MRRIEGHRVVNGILGIRRLYCVPQYVGPEARDSVLVNAVETNVAEGGYCHGCLFLPVVIALRGLGIPTKSAARSQPAQLNDVEDYRGFAATLVRPLRRGGRVALALNNPYAYVIRIVLDKGIVAYFASGTTHPCGLASLGIRVAYYHRTLPEYLDAFLDAGLCLTRLVDVDHPAIAAERAAGRPLPSGEELPRFMVLAFTKP